MLKKVIIVLVSLILFSISVSASPSILETATFPDPSTYGDNIQFQCNATTPTDTSVNITYDFYVDDVFESSGIGFNIKEIENNGVNGYFQGFSMIKTSPNSFANFYPIASYKQYYTNGDLINTSSLSTTGKESFPVGFYDSGSSKIRMVGEANPNSNNIYYTVCDDYLTNCVDSTHTVAKAGITIDAVYEFKQFPSGKWVYSYHDLTNSLDVYEVCNSGLTGCFVLHNNTQYRYADFVENSDGEFLIVSHNYAYVYNSGGSLQTEFGLGFVSNSGLYGEVIPIDGDEFRYFVVWGGALRMGTCSISGTGCSQFQSDTGDQFAYYHDVGEVHIFEGSTYRIRQCNSAVNSCSVVQERILNDATPTTYVNNNFLFLDSRRISAMRYDTIIADPFFNENELLTFFQVDSGDYSQGVELTATCNAQDSNVGGTIISQNVSVTPVVPYANIDRFEVVSYPDNYGQPLDVEFDISANALFITVRIEEDCDGTLSTTNYSTGDTEYNVSDSFTITQECNIQLFIQTSSASNNATISNVNINTSDWINITNVEDDVSDDYVIGVNATINTRNPIENITTFHNCTENNLFIYDYITGVGTTSYDFEGIANYTSQYRNCQYNIGVYDNYSVYRELNLNLSIPDPFDSFSNGADIFGRFKYFSMSSDTYNGNIFLNISQPDFIFYPSGGGSNSFGGIRLYNIGVGDTFTVPTRAYQTGGTLHFRFYPISYYMIDGLNAGNQYSDGSFYSVQLISDYIYSDYDGTFDYRVALVDAYARSNYLVNDNLEIVESEANRGQNFSINVEWTNDIEGIRQVRLEHNCTDGSWDIFETYNYDQPFNVLENTLFSTNNIVGECGIRTYATTPFGYTTTSSPVTINIQSNEITFTEIGINDDDIRNGDSIIFTTNISSIVELENASIYINCSNSNEYDVYSFENISSNTYILTQTYEINKSVGKSCDAYVEAVTVFNDYGTEELIFLLNNYFTDIENNAEVSVWYDLNNLNMTDGCNDEITFSPSVENPLEICVNDGTTDYGCNIITDYTINSADVISSGLFVWNSSKNYRFKINWNRISYLTGANYLKKDSGQYSEKGSQCSMSPEYTSCFGDVDLLYYEEASCSGEIGYYGTFKTELQALGNPIRTTEDNYLLASANTDLAYRSVASIYWGECSGCQPTSGTKNTWSYCSAGNVESNLCTYAGNTTIYTDYFTNYNTQDFNTSDKIKTDGEISLFSVVYEKTGTPPVISLSSQSTTHPIKNEVINFTFYATDDILVGYIEIEHNCNGQQTNQSIISSQNGYVSFYIPISNDCTINTTAYDIDDANSNVLETIITLEKTNPESLVRISNKPVYDDDMVLAITYVDTFDNAYNSWTANETRWYKNGVLQAGLNDLTTIPSANIIQGENWSVSARTIDTWTTSDWVNDSVTIGTPTINSYGVIDNTVGFGSIIDFRINAYGDFVADSCKLTLEQNNASYNIFSTNIDGDILSVDFDGYESVGTITWNKIECRDIYNNLVEKTTYLTIEIIPIEEDDGSLTPTTGGGGGTTTFPLFSVAEEDKIRSTVKDEVLDLPIFIAMSTILVIMGVITTENLLARKNEK